MDKAVIDEMVAISKKGRVFVSMPYVESLSPRYLNQEGRFQVYETQEFAERREGIFHIDEGTLSPLDHGGLYGDACFEGILITNGQIFVLKEHLLRWWESARKLHITMPYTLDDMAARILETVQVVGFSEKENGYLRPVLSRGVGNLGIHPKKCVAPTIYIICSTIQLYPAKAYETGIELSIARHTRRPGESIIDPNIKSNNYLNNIFGLIETLPHGRLETMMITAEGNVAEATADNLFCIHKLPGWEKDPSKVQITTPDPAYCLKGITRLLIMEEARKRGYSVKESKDMLPIDFIGSDKECFMTGTGCGLMPVVGIEDKVIGEGKPGDVTLGLLESIRAVMANERYGLNIHADQKALAEYMSRPAFNA
jgi:branched-chain amino acid aminotransferase